MYTFKLATALTLLLATVPVFSQVTTVCNPRERDCDPDPAFGTDHTFDFSKKPSRGLWNETVRGVKYDSENGATFTIAKQGDSPTLRTQFFIFWGRTEVHLKTAPGQGVISSMMWISKDLDEIDFEMFGTKPNMVATNFFGKGNQKFTNGGEHDQPASIIDEFHNYTTVWTAEKLEWYINGILVRTLLPADADGGENYPQTPMQLSLGIWAGGDPDLPEGTRQWAGGDTDYSKGPYSMHVKSVQITDFSSGKEYAWGDRSGSAGSIKISPGESAAKTAIASGIIVADDDKDDKVDTKTSSSDPDVQTDHSATALTNAENTWHSLSDTTKTAIAGSVGGVAGIAIIIGLVYFFRQRRAGARQARIADEKWQAEQAEDGDLRVQRINPEGFAAVATEYNSQSKDVSGLNNPLPVYRDDASSHRHRNSWDMQPQDEWDPVHSHGRGIDPQSPLPLLDDDGQSPRAPGSSIVVNAVLSDVKDPGRSRSPSSRNSSLSRSPQQGRNTSSDWRI